MVSALDIVAATLSTQDLLGLTCDKLDVDQTFQ